MKTSEDIVYILTCFFLHFVRFSNLSLNLDRHWLYLSIEFSERLNLEFTYFLMTKPSRLLEILNSGVMALWYFVKIFFCNNFTFHREFSVYLSHVPIIIVSSSFLLKTYFSFECLIRICLLILECFICVSPNIYQKFLSMSFKTLDLSKEWTWIELNFQR